MSNEETTVQAPAEPKKEELRGDRGELGVATAALTIYQRWHEAHFTRVSAATKHSPNKRVWVRNPGAPSLKVFAKALAKDGDKLAKDWFAHKRGSMNQKRSDSNVKAQKEAAFATHAAKRKKKGEGGGK